ncbi:hypothetical protein KKI17_03430 [Patescibacteria group bacterium]|nr:hypothetical protein [Patescibacteria group bacterium]
MNKIFVRLLYLTPIGYLFGLLDFFTGKEGIEVDLGSRLSPISANIKRAPSLKERLNWFVNGMFLFGEASWVAFTGAWGTYGTTFALFAWIFSVVSIVSAFAPKFPWNKKVL